MADPRKNKIYNLQFVTDDIPKNITSDDVGRLWIDKNKKKIVVGLVDEHDNSLTTCLLTDFDRVEIVSNAAKIYFSEVIDIQATILPQEISNVHFENGYDFFSDELFLTNADQSLNDYYSFFYLEVPSTTSKGYVRTINTVNGETHIRCATGYDVYMYDGNEEQIVNYSKIILPRTVKSIVEIRFENKDIMEKGFFLHSDKKTIFIFGDPEGFFLNSKVKVKCLN